MGQGFLIDTDACIGCHACSTACKSENQVPLGVYRTWVKSVEVGAYPDVRRSFQVTRCNHCENPPCVRICPTGAMHRRADGIVDFDGDACIGCKACLQACPYDAIHIDPATHTAAKCHFCAHRVDVGLEPACVVVCPVHAIVSGDLDDPESEIRRRLGRSDVTVRRPDQGTRPKLFYVGGAGAALHPTGAPRDTTFAAAQVASFAETPTVAPGSAGPVAASLMRVSYNASHAAPWHWPIPAYLVTKHVAGGLFAALSALRLLGRESPDLAAGALGLVSLWVTLLLLVFDLDRPDRFLFLLTRPQWRSWVARAAWLLTAFSVAAHLVVAADVAVATGLLEPTVALPVRRFLAAATLPLAALAAVYSAWLFAQCEGRDYWQSTHLAPLMALQAAAMGTLSLAAVADVPPAVLGVAAAGLAGAAAVMLLGDLGTSMPSETARLAAWDLTRGRHRATYAAGIVVGHAVPLALLAASAPPSWAFLSATVGLFAWAWAVVAAPQSIPNS